MFAHPSANRRSDPRRPALATALPWSHDQAGREVLENPEEILKTWEARPPTREDAMSEFVKNIFEERQGRSLA